MEKYPKLINPNDNSAITINNTAFSIGRSLSCDHIIQNLDISRFHCIIKKKDSKWTLYDRSTNGTSVNSKLYKFNQSVDLKNGDVIQLGPGNLSFVFSSLNEDEIDDVTIKKSDPMCSSNTLFPNDDSLLEEAVSLLAETLEDPIGAEDEVSTSTTDQKSENNTQIDNNKKDAEAEEAATSSKNKQSQSDGKNNRANDAGNIDIMENELTCSICSELFIKAVTLNCSHTYCKYCIEEWKKNKKSCPICRNVITTIAPTLVLDNFIEKIISTQSDEMKETRKELIKQREELAVNAAGSSNVSTTGAVEHNSIVEIFSDDGEDDDLDGDDSDASYLTDDDYDDYEYCGSNKNYYGGYGRCFICNQPGHWANGCPFKRR